jgi:hypothetical protein
MGSLALNEVSGWLDGDLIHIFNGLDDGLPSHAIRFRQRLSGTSTDGAEPSPAPSGEA